MKNLVIVSLTILLTIASGFIVPHPEQYQNPHPAQRYRQNLDVGYHEKWREIMTDYKGSLRAFIDYFLYITKIPQNVIDAAGQYGQNVYKNLYPEEIAEIEVVAELGQVDFGLVFALNLLYELTAFQSCTATLVRTAQGQILHGRNWDFEFFRYFSNQTAQVDYYKDNQYQYTADIVVGAIWYLNAMKPGQFAIAINARHTETIFNNLIDLFALGWTPTTWLMRQVIDEEQSYYSAFTRLKTTDISTAVYFSISGSGINEGAIIEKDRGYVHAVYELSDKQWYLVQTNYDRSKEDPYHDMRRYPCEARIYDIGNIHMDEKILFEKVMYKWPTFNLATIFTSVMVPATGYINTTVWW